MNAYVSAAFLLNTRTTIQVLLVGDPVRQPFEDEVFGAVASLG
jgi:hypothetical protein